MTNYEKVIYITEPERLFFHKRNGILKIDQPVKMP